MSNSRMFSGVLCQLNTFYLHKKRKGKKYVVKPLKTTPRRRGILTWFYVKNDWYINSKGSFKRRSSVNFYWFCFRNLPGTKGSPFSTYLTYKGSVGMTLDLIDVTIQYIRHFRSHRKKVYISLFLFLTPVNLRNDIPVSPSLWLFLWPSRVIERVSDTFQ